MLTNHGIIAAAIKQAVLMNENTAADVRCKARIAGLTEDQMIARLAGRLADEVEKPEPTPAKATKTKTTKQLNAQRDKIIQKQDDDRRKYHEQQERRQKKAAEASS